eukprot:jgi/Bigna1/71825/fgenesh1_pg.17_\
MKFTSNALAVILLIAELALSMQIHEKDLAHRAVLPEASEQSSVSRLHESRAAVGLISKARDEMMSMHKLVGTLLERIDDGNNLSVAMKHELQRVNMNLMGVKELLWRASSFPSRLNNESSSTTTSSSSSPSSTITNGSPKVMEWKCEDRSRMWHRKEFYNLQSGYCSSTRDSKIGTHNSPLVTSEGGGKTVSNEHATEEHHRQKQDHFLSGLRKSGTTSPLRHGGTSNVTGEEGNILKKITNTDTKVAASMRMTASGMGATHEGFYEKSPWFRLSFQACNDSWCHRHVGPEAETPSSGEHRPVWAKWGEYQQLWPERWIHNLEHGGIAFLYHPCASQETVDQLRHLAKTFDPAGGRFRYILTPYPKLQSAIGLASWQWLFEADCPGSPAVSQEMRRFMTEHYRHAREDLPWDGVFNETWIRY